MRIVIATSTAFHLHHLALQLAKRGHEIEFHSYLPRSKLRHYGLANEQIVSHFARLLPWSALALLRGFGRVLLPMRERLFALVDRRIAATMGKADLFIGLSAVAVESARQARDAGAMVLIERGSSHILRQQASALAAGMAPPSQLYVDRELAGYALADRIIVLSRYAASSFAEQGEAPDHIEIQTLGTNLTQFVPPAMPPPLPVRAIFVGAWTRRKGCDLIASLMEQIPDLTMTHVGMPGDIPFPQSARFRSLGHLDHAALAQELQRHHLMLFPSRDDGFGMVMAEALASGLRVVASDASGGPDLAALIGERFVDIVPAGSLDDLVAATRRQIADIAAAPAEQAAPRELIAALDWDGYGDRYARMIERLVADR